MRTDSFLKLNHRKTARQFFPIEVAHRTSADSRMVWTRQAAFRSLVARDCRLPLRLLRSGLRLAGRQPVLQVRVFVTLRPTVAAWRRSLRREFAGVTDWN